MKKFFVISALLVSLVACDKEEEKAPAADVVADADASVAADVAEDVTAVDVPTSTTPVETPDASSSTDASVGG